MRTAARCDGMRNARARANPSPSRGLQRADWRLPRTPGCRPTELASAIGRAAGGQRACRALNAAEAPIAAHRERRLQQRAHSPAALLGLAPFLGVRNVRGPRLSPVAGSPWQLSSSGARTRPRRRTHSPPPAPQPAPPVFSYSLHAGAPKAAGFRPSNRGRTVKNGLRDAPQARSSQGSPPRACSGWMSSS